VALPIYTVIRRFDAALTAFGIVLVTAVILKFTWYDNLSAEEVVVETVPSATVPAV
jgi:hypothetical protein